MLKLLPLSAMALPKPNANPMPIMPPIKHSNMASINEQGKGLRGLRDGLADGIVIE